MGVAPDAPVGQRRYEERQRKEGAEPRCRKAGHKARANASCQHQRTEKKFRCKNDAGNHGHQLLIKKSANRQAQTPLGGNGEPEIADPLQKIGRQLEAGSHPSGLGGCVRQDEAAVEPVE